jgi:Protein of unknown function (DUF3558)
MLSVKVRFLIAVAVTTTLAGCGAPGSHPASSAPTDNGFHSGECNLVSDDDVNSVAGAGRFTRTVVNETGCFWQENSMIAMVGAGMGISTWWYRGSDVDTERTLERMAGRELTELSLDGNSGFRASDTNACSVYVTKGNDVITWSIQTLNPASLPELCSIVDRLAQMTQDRVT